MPNIPHIIEVALLLLVAFLIGCVIGYLLRSKLFAPAAGKTEAKPVAPKAAPAKPAVASSEKLAASKTAPKPDAAPLPEKLKEPRDGNPDNLKLIKGVGPKIEGKLNEIGVFHFEQIAAWDKAAIARFDEKLSFKGRIERERWVPQAKALAKK